MLEYKQITLENPTDIEELSMVATPIIKDYYDPIIGPTQNDYMITLFQSVEGITNGLKHNKTYYLVYLEKNPIGFLGFYEKENKLYLDKFYLDKKYRGKGYGKKILYFIFDCAKKLNLDKVFLNVNKNNPTIKIYEKLGFYKIRDEKNDIGSGFYMDDYVYEIKIP